MKLSELKKSDRMLFAVGAVIVVFGVLLLFGFYIEAMGLVLTWVRRLSQILVPVSLIAIGFYVVWGVRHHRFDQFLSENRVQHADLSRSRTDVRIAGVCGGIAHYFGVDSVFVRVIAVLLGLASPLFALITYGILWLVLLRS